MFLTEHVYSRIADPDTNEVMFSADVYYHSNCFTKCKDLKLLICLQYVWTKTKPDKRFIFQYYIKFIAEIISRGNGITLY